MKLTKKTIQTIQKAFDDLSAEMESEIAIDNLTVGLEEVVIEFPRDDIKIRVETLMNYIPEFKNLVLSAEKATSNRFTQMPVFSSGKPLDYLLNEIEFNVIVPGEFKIKLIDNPLLIGIAATKLGLYDKIAPPCSSYFAVEVEYEASERRRSQQEELKIIKSFLFEFSNLAHCSIDITVIEDSDYYNEYKEPEKQIIKTSFLQDFSEGMDLFRKALESHDEEIRFLYYYKIIEYYSPIAAKRTAFDTLTKKLDSLKFAQITSADLNSIIAIADRYRLAQSDKELAQSLLGDSVDIVDSYKLLPSEIRTRLSKQHQFKADAIDYSTKQEVRQGILTSIGTILYSTRNSIVHSKSTYRSDNHECKKEDLAKLNIFLNKVCYNIINWNTRLPNHIKYE